MTTVTDKPPEDTHPAIADMVGELAELGVTRQDAARLTETGLAPALVLVPSPRPADGGAPAAA